MFPSLLVRHRRSLGRPLEPVLIQELASLEFLAELVQLRSEALQFQPLHGLHEGPKLLGMQRDSAAHLVRSGLVVMSALVEKE
jgi:hypothetical protein